MLGVLLVFISLHCDLFPSWNVDQVIDHQHLEGGKTENENKVWNCSCGIDWEFNSGSTSFCSWGKGASCPKANQDYDSDPN
jgi:hypothetical protein